MGQIQTLDELFSFLLRRFKVIALVTLAGMVLTLAYAKSLPRLYEAAAVLQVEAPRVGRTSPEQGGRDAAQMLQTIEQGADAVVGSRYVAGGATADWPLHRRLLSRWGNRYTGLVLGMGVRDCTSGFRAYRADALRSIDPSSTTAEGYAFLTELVRRLASSGRSIVEVPIVFRDRQFGTSKMSGRIVVESMLLVTRWGVSDLVHGRRPSRRR